MAKQHDQRGRANLNLSVCVVNVEWKRALNLRRSPQPSVL